MEKKIKINTAEGQNSFTTANIKGFLDALIINLTEIGELARVEIIIESELGYVIFHEHDLKPDYYAPRVRAVAQLADARRALDTPAMDKFNLNEKLIITIIGPRDIDVELIMRLT